LNLEKLDNFIKENIPCGQEVFNKEENYSDLDNLKCKNNINMNRAKCSIGTLGGGNHFIEVDKNNNDDIYIVVHSGSRYLGKQIAEYYQNKAYKGLTDYSEQINKTIENLKSQGKYTEISNAISNIKHQNPKIPKDLAFVDDVNFDNYLFDMNIAQRYAYCNRTKMINTIVKYLGITEITEKFQTIHNYIDIQNKILRKGAISAQTNEKVIIPMNMRDGSLICMGKGNPDWNCSAPHGAGRIMSRSQAKENVTLNEFIKSMEGIYTTTVNTSTIDESPMAYKPMNEIIKNIQDTVEIKNIIKPIYNFKASN
jgi:RNA-splicing ligase RtcB